MRLLSESMDLAGRCLLAWLNPEKEYLPTGGWQISHDTGRWWDAILRIEDAIGFEIPAQLEAAMLRNFQIQTDNPDGLLANNPAFQPANINPHNLRESMIAYHALVRWRKNAWARAGGRRLLAAISRAFGPNGRMDYTRLGLWGTLPFTGDPSHTESPGSPWFDGTATTGRCLEGIIWFYQATGESVALDVADRIAHHHLAASTSPDGATRSEILDPANVGHNHSYLGTLRGLLLWGLLTGQRQYVETVAATYDRSVFVNNVSYSGWTPHDLGKLRFPNPAGDPVCETASCGDAIQIALWLAMNTGRPELLDDVERLVRARILPEQITQGDVEKAKAAGWTLGPRELGGWGVHGDPYGKGCILDVLAAVAHTLVDVYHHIVTRDGAGLRVNLHFTRQHPLADVVSQRGEHASLSVRPHVHENLWIRLPQWVEPDDCRLEIGGQSVAGRLIGRYLFVPREQAAIEQEIILKHPLPPRTTEEHFRGSGKTYKLSWRGDEVVGISPTEGQLCMYAGM